MHGLKQAAILAYKQLFKRLVLHGYVPIPTSDRLWKHESKPTLFALYVDDFGVKYNFQEDLNHLTNALKKYYKIKVDLEGENLCGLKLEWNYELGYVDISMPNYAQKKFQKFLNKNPLRP